MGRPRKPGTEWRPPKTHCEKGRYYVRHDDGTQTWLAPATATQEQVWEAYLKLPKAEAAPPARTTLRTFLTEYEGSLQFRKLAGETQLDARKAFKAMCNHPTKEGRKFGDVDVRALTMVVMRGYIDKRGEVTESRANKELSYASAAFNWGMERGKVALNPCAGVTRYKIGARERYVTDEEYADRYQLAGELGRPDIQAMMEFAFLCRLRENEIVKILDSPAFITPQGVMARRGKGSKTQIIGWTKRLEDAVALARATKANPRWKMKRKVESPCLIVSPHSGTRLILGTFRNVWAEIRLEAKKRGHATDWTFHDLKAKGTTDAEGDKHLASGHKTMRMTQVYVRLPEKVGATK